MSLLRRTPPLTLASPAGRIDDDGQVGERCELCFQLLQPWPRVDSVGSQGPLVEDNGEPAPTVSLEPASATAALGAETSSDRLSVVLVGFHTRRTHTPMDVPTERDDPPAPRRPILNSRKAIQKSGVDESFSPWKMIFRAQDGADDDRHA